MQMCWWCFNVHHKTEHPFKSSDPSAVVLVVLLDNKTFTDVFWLAKRIITKRAHSEKRFDLILIHRSALIAEGTGASRSVTANPWLIDETEETKGLTFGDIRQQQQSIIEGTYWWIAETSSGFFRQNDFPGTHTSIICDWRRSYSFIIPPHCFSTIYRIINWFQKSDKGFFILSVLHCQKITHTFLHFLIFLLSSSVTGTIVLNVIIYNFNIVSPALSLFLPFSSCLQLRMQAWMH